MKLIRTFIASVTTAIALVTFAACSHDSDSENTQVQVSFEGTFLYGSLLDVNFVGAHTAYVSMHDSLLSDEENLYSYTATSDTVTLQMQKIAAPDGSGKLVTQAGYIGYWESEDFKYANIITDDVTSWYQTETFTVTTADDTVYTFTNKTTYTRSGDETSSVMMTSGTSKSSSGTETTLFSDLSGYTDIESKYSASEFTNVVTVHVYKVTTTIENEEKSVSIAPYTGYPFSLVGASVGKSESAVGSDDADTQEDINLRKEFFASRYEELSANDWAMVKAEFMPRTYRYEKNKTVTKSALKEDGTYEHYNVTYDYYLTQQYTSAETSIFMYAPDDVADLAQFTGNAAVFKGFTGSISFVKNGSTTESYHSESVDTSTKKMTFFEVIESDEEESADSDDTLAKTITATYSVNENGNATTLTLAFETKQGFTVSGKTITLEYSPVEEGLMIDVTKSCKPRF